MTFRQLMEKRERLTAKDFLAYWQEELRYWSTIPFSNEAGIPGVDVNYMQNSEGTISVDRMERIAHCKAQITSLHQAA